MRTSEDRAPVAQTKKRGRGLLVGAGLALVLIAGAMGPSAARPPVFASPEKAFEQGIGAYRAGHVELAIPALEFAAKHQIVFAQYYLARIYAENSTPTTDHARAFELFRQIADENADVDPEDSSRAPVVAKSFVALARYQLTGVPEAGVDADTELAARYFAHAATYFNDADAQFEMSKLYLSGSGVPRDPRRAIYWLNTLSERGHPGAQAFLADQIWRGKNTPRDPNRALALITLALESADPGERIWMEDIYQNIYCGASKGVRHQADGLVADWRQKFGRPALRPSTGPSRGADLIAKPVRDCDNGEIVPGPSRQASEGGATSTSSGVTASTAVAPAAGFVAAPRAMTPSLGVGLSTLAPMAPAGGPTR